MAAEDYVKAMGYEMLIRNTFNCQTGMRNGAHQSFIQNAMSAERGDTYSKHLGSFEKQFGKVRSYVAKALIKLAKTKPYCSSADYFNILLDQIEHSGSTEHLMVIVDKALDKVTELRKNIKSQL